MLPDEIQSAAAAGLRYAIPKGVGIRRQRAGKGFIYLDSDGRPIKNRETLERIRSLVIPPAWSSVWISPTPNGHIQAVGRDARGRKQYRYHLKYRTVRDVIKFDRMSAFGKALPRIRRVVMRDLHTRDLTKRKVLAAVVKLLETTYIRVGNEEYAEENGSFGLTTLRNKHLQILGNTLKFRFRGKSAQRQEITLRDARLATILRKCRDLPGSALFEYLDENGEPQTIDSGDVNEYLRRIGGADFTAKDFRTWGGTCLATNLLLGELAGAKSGNAKKSVLIKVVKGVASELGNKPATCKKYYIHPAVMDGYSSGTLHTLAKMGFRDSQGCYLYEQIVLSLLAPARRAPRRAA